MKTNDLPLQLQYCWDSKLMRGLMSSVAETPEIILARENTKKISDVRTHSHQAGTWSVLC